MPIASGVRSMPSVETKYFGTLPYAQESVFDFPQGLPAFEEEKTFVLIEAPQGEKAQGDEPAATPLVFLQSLTRAGLCFLAFPILAVDKDYQLAVAPEDLEDLDLDAGLQPALGSEVLVLALISLHDELLATANLMAPIVLNLKTRRGLQAIRRDSRYSHEHPVSGRPAGKSASEQIC